MSTLASNRFLGLFGSTGTASGLAGRPAVRERYVANGDTASASGPTSRISTFRGWPGPCHGCPGGTDFHGFEKPLKHSIANRFRADVADGGAGFMYKVSL